MEQNILKRYNEIHIMLWEEVIKVFAARTKESIEYFRENQEQNGEKKAVAMNSKLYHAK